jgi:hypothetical protein
MRLDRVQKGLFSVLQSALGNDATVQWSYGQPTFNQLQNDLVTLRIASGPTKKYVTRPRGTAFLPLTSLELIVNDPVVEGQRYAVTLNDYQHFIDAVSGSNPTSIATSLVANINADSFDPYSAALGASGSFTITPASFGAIYQASKTTNISTGTISRSSNAALLTQGQRGLTIDVETFSKNINPYNGAWALMDQINDVTENSNLMDDLFFNYGLNIYNVGAPVDISETVGGNWETRCSLEMECNVLSSKVRPIDIIEAMDYTIETTTIGNAEITVSGSI